VITQYILPGDFSIEFGSVYGVIRRLEINKEATWPISYTCGIPD